MVEPPEQRVTPPRTVAVYARVSNSENKKNLETQAEHLISWCNAQGWSVAKVIKEWGSGINDQRPKFLALLADPKISQIVVEHQDRASRFGVAYIQTLQQNGSESSESKARQGQEETPAKAQKQVHADSCSNPYPTDGSQSRKTGGVRSAGDGLSGALPTLRDPFLH